MPVLLISGELDPVTPVREGERAAAAFPNGLHVIVPHAGHGYGGMPGAECVDSLIVRFVRAGSAEGLNAEACTRRIRRPPFVTEIPEAVAVDPALLEPLAGAYATTDASFAVRIEVLPGALRLASPTLNLVASPLSPTRFQWEGQAPGSELEFAADASTLTIRTRDQQLFLTRQP